MRIPPLEPPYEDDVARELEALMPGRPPIGLFRTLARNLPMSRAMRGWGGYVLGRHLTLTRRDREIVIDRTTARTGCEYEWGIHVQYFAARVGLTEAQVASLTHGGPGDACWTEERDRLLIEAADALHDRSDIDDALWSRLAAVFDEKQLMDVLLVAGWYHTISFVARGARVPLEPGAPTFASVATP